MDGESVFIWDDNWILGLDSKKLGHPGLKDSQISKKKVADLIDDTNGEGNLEHAEQWLTEEQSSAIKIIPTCVQGRKDVLV